MRALGIILLVTILAGLVLSRPPTSPHPTAAPVTAAMARVSPPSAGTAARLTEVAETPAAAVQRLLAVPAAARLNATTALLLSLVDRPDEALQVTRDLVQQDPAFIREHGSVLIALLTANHDFASALVFAEQGGPERPLWLAQTLDAWSERQPELAALATLTELDGEGFPEIATGWAGRDPAALAQFTLELPAGAASSLALEQVRQIAETATTLSPATRTRLLAALDRPPD